MLAGSFKKSYSHQEIVDLVEKVTSKHPGYVPCVIEPHSSTDPVPSKVKYIIPGDVAWGRVVNEVRKNIQLSGPAHSISVLVNETFPAPHTLVSQVYEAHKASDGILYAVYCQEATFG